VNEEYIHRLQELVNQSPREYGYGFNCWTAHWLSKHLAKELEIEISVRHINRLLTQMGLSKRQKREADRTTDNCDQDTCIKICDLPAKSEPDFDWSFNLIQISNQLIEVNS
jgi:transposase